MKSLALSLMFGLSFGLAASAATLTNGNFELTDSTPGNIHGILLSDLGPGQWDVYSQIPGWTSYGNSAGIEVQYNNVVVNAHSVYRYVELDSHRNPAAPNTNSAMYQAVELGAGWHQLSFWYRPRTGATGDNGIKAFLDADAPGWSPANELIFANETSATQTDWEQFTKDIYISAAGTYNLTLSALGADNSLGGFIDDVALEGLENPGEVPEPATMGILGLGLAALAVARRFRS